MNSTTRVQHMLWPLGAKSDHPSSITLGTRIRDRLVRIIANQWRGWTHGQLAPLPGCYRRLPNGRSFVFIHINKTGGTSIARAYGASYKTHLTAAQARRRVSPRLWEDAFKFAIVRNPWDKVVSHYEFRKMTNQTGLAQNNVDFETWVTAAYGDRNPVYYDNPKMFQSQTDWISAADGTPLMDYVGRFEDLGQAFETVSERLQMKVSLDHLNKSPSRDYRSYYSDQTASIIADRFASDCERWGYSF